MKKPRLWDAVDHISEDGLRDGSRLVPPGALFVVVRGMVLAKDLPIALAMVPMAFNQDMKAILPRDGIDPEYLLYALVRHKFLLLPEIGTSAHGTRRIGTAAINNLRLPVPPSDEQKRIAHALRTVDENMDAQVGSCKSLERMFNSLLHNVMTGKVRVYDLEVPGPAETAP